MLTPIALTNPTITALGTNRSSLPPFSRPAMIMTIPVMIASVYSARSGSGRLWRSESATMSAMAPVACTAMNVLLVKNVAPTMPNR